MASIEGVISTFQSVDEQTRLQILLDYSRKLPELPRVLAEAIERTDAGRIHECMTPVWLWVVASNGRIRVHARVGEEAPTVRGILSIIVHAYEDATPAELAQVPQDLVHKLGLSAAVRMNRAVGLNAMLQRLRRQAEQLLEQEAAP